MQLRHLWLTDFRSHRNLELGFGPGTCVIRGPNGVGKSNLLEAIGWLATMASFRGAPTDALITAGEPRAVIRGELHGGHGGGDTPVGAAEGRELLVEAELTRTGRHRVMVNRQRLRRSRDLLGTVRATVFSPDDLELVKGAPSGRRDYLDDLLVSLHPRNDAVRQEWEKSLRQRNALLKQVGGRLDDAAEVTLGVWDETAARSGSALVTRRRELVDRLATVVDDAYAELAGGPQRVELVYEASWEGELGDALASARPLDLRRGVTTVGPHRDELVVRLNTLAARTHASQGEQRCLALALRLASHRLVAEEHGEAPLLLLDDVFSELDERRAAALLGSLPAGQAFLTTASGLPTGIDPDTVVEVGADGVVTSSTGSGGTPGG